MAQVYRLLADADQCLESEDAAAALAKATSALAVARELNDAGGVADALRKVVQATSASGKLAEAVELASEELGNFSTEGDTRGEATLHLALAEAQQSCGALKEAFDSAVESQRLLRAAGAVTNGSGSLRSLLAESLLATLGVEICRGDQRVADPMQCYQKAIDAGKEALDLFQATGNVKGQAASMHGIAAARINSRGFEGGIRTAKEALRLWQTLGSARSEVFELQSIANWYMQAGKPQQALPFAQEALELAREEQCGQNWEAAAVQLLAQVLCASGQDDRAAQVASDAVSHFQKVYARRGEAVALNAVLVTHLARGDPWTGLQIAKQALAAFTDLGDKGEQISLLRTMARLNLQMHRLDEAVDFARQGLLLCQGAPDCARERIKCMNLLVELQMASQRTKDAVQVAEDTRDHFSGMDDRRREASTRLTMASINLQSNSPQDATWACEDAQEMFEDVADKAGEAVSIQMMALCHMAEEKHDDAIDALRKSVALIQQAGDRKAEVGNLMLIAQIYELKLAAGQRDPSSKEFRKVAVEAVQAAKDAAALAGKCGERSLVAAAQCVLSRTYHMAAKGMEAAQAAKLAVVSYRECGDRYGEASALVLSANALAACGQEQASKEAASRALLLFRQIGHRHGELMAEAAIDEVESRGVEEEDVPQAAAKPSEGVQRMLQPAARELSVDSEEIGRKVRSTVVDIIGLDDLTDDTPLMMAGLTSQSAVLLRNALTKQMGGGNLPFTMMFDFPSVSALKDYFVTRS